MGKLTKNQKLALAKIEAGKAYSLGEASQLVKDITYTKFDASLDIDVRLGVDPRKANQMVRGVVSLPHGTGKQVRVLVLCTPDAEAAAGRAALRRNSGSLYKILPRGVIFLVRTCKSGCVEVAYAKHGYPVRFGTFQRPGEEIHGFLVALLLPEAAAGFKSVPERIELLYIAGRNV